MDKEYFDSGKNAENYLKMIVDYDGSKLLQRVKKVLKGGSSILELGMGGGNDLDILNEDYKCYGSDGAKRFIEIYRKKKGRKVPDDRLFVLDAKTLEIDMSFDCIFTNKVLMHLTKEDMEKSLKRQREIVKDNGCVIHTLWVAKETKEEHFNGLRFVYYSKGDVVKVFGECGWVVESSWVYKEFEEDDSIMLVCRKKREGK